MGSEGIQFRPMGPQDLEQVPLDCHGSSADLADRLESLGSAAILAFDGGQHVGRLQFRRHDPLLRSAAGVFSPDYWGDFGGRAPPLPERTLVVYCYHVGQPEPVYAARGFVRVDGWTDHDMHAALVDRDLVARDSDPDKVTAVGLCVRWRGGA